MSTQLKAKGSLVPPTKEIKVALDRPEVAMATYDETSSVLRKLLPSLVPTLILGGISFVILQLFAVQGDLGDFKSAIQSDLGDLLTPASC